MSSPVSLGCIPLVAPLHTILSNGRITTHAEFKCRLGTLNNPPVQNDCTEVINSGRPLLVRFGDLRAVLEQLHHELAGSFRAGHRREIERLPGLDIEICEAKVGRGAR